MNPTNSSLLILLWNANGLRPHVDELTTLLNDRRIDITLVTETHFTSRSYVNLPGYVCYRTDHPDNSAHGGTCILIRKQISHHSLPPVSTNTLQCTSISVKTFPFPLNLSAVYCPPNKPLTQAQLLSHFLSLGPRFVSGGDYNAKHPRWGSRLATPRGRLLHNILNSQSYDYISPSSYTYWPTDSTRLPDLLDFFVTSGIRSIHSSATTLTELSSDHSPVLLTLSIHPIYLPKNPSLTPGPMDWIKFQCLLDDQTNLRIPLKTPDDIDSAIQNFTEMIQGCAWESSRPRRSCSSSTPPLNLPQHVRLLIGAKRRARAAWQRYRYPSDFITLKKLTRQLQSQLSSLRSDCYNSYISSLDSRDHSLWRATKRILSFHPTSYPLRGSDGSWARSDKERADEFGTHLHKVFTPHPDVFDPQHSILVDEFLDSPLQLTLPPPPFLPSEVAFIISKLPCRKAPGADLITSEILRHLPRRSIVLLTSLFNAVLRTTYFPISWKFSYVKMILKPNKPSYNPSSYRPICLLPLFSKILEKLLLKRLIPLLDTQNIIPNHQFGFRSRHSCTQQCLRIVDAISSSLERGEYCGGVFLDVAQAFDRVWHPGLLFKLKSLLPSTYYLILKSYLEDRYFRISEKGELSSYFPARASVPQGSVLGPILYTIYTADIPSNPQNIIATFADDTCILSSHKDPSVTTKNLQSHLNLIEYWCRMWRIKVNGTKSVHVAFTLRRQPCPPVSFNNNQIPSADYTRYLGLFVDKRLTWNPHTRLKRIDLNRKYGLLQRLLCKTSKLSITNKLTIYKQILKPTWTYGIELWGSAKPSNIARIQRFQSKTLRTILDAPWYVSNHTIHTDLRIPTVEEVTKSRFIKFHSRLSTHPNPLAVALSSISHPDSPPRRLKRKWPRDLLSDQ